MHEINCVRVLGGNTNWEIFYSSGRQAGPEGAGDAPEALLDGARGGLQGTRPFSQRYSRVGSRGSQVYRNPFSNTPNSYNQIYFW